MGKRQILPVLAVLLLCLPAYADTVILKNGKRIRTAETWEEGGLVKCHRYGAVIGYPKNLVRKITEDEAEEHFEDSGVRENEKREEPSEQDGENSVRTDGNSAGASPAQFRVEKVYDGDSFMASGCNIHVKVRLAGIDAPERADRRRGVPAQPYSEKARKCLENMILNMTVSVRGYGTGIYNRQIAEVFSDGRNAGLELVRAGLAEVYRGKPPDNFDPEPYRRAEAEAAESLKGLWALGSSRVSPEKWRKMHRKKRRQ